LPLLSQCRFRYAKRCIREAFEAHEENMAHVNEQNYAFYRIIISADSMRVQFFLDR